MGASALAEMTLRRGLKRKCSHPVKAHFHRLSIECNQIGRPSESKTRTYLERIGAGRRIAGPETTSMVRLARKTSDPRPHQVPGHALHKGFTETKRRRYTGQQPGTKSASRPADKPVVNRGSTAGFFPPSVYIGFRLFVLLERRRSDVSSMPWRVRWTFVSWANSSVGTQSCSTPPGRRRAPRPDPPVVCPGFGFDRYRRQLS